MLLRKKYIKAFILGSSLCVTAFPVTGIIIGSSVNGTQGLSWLTIFIFFPIIFGITNILTAFLGVRSKQQMFFLGAVLGLLLSSFGLFALNLPARVYGLVGVQQYLALIGGPIFYGLVWLLPMCFVNKLFEIHDS